MSRIPLPFTVFRAGRMVTYQKPLLRCVIGYGAPKEKWRHFFLTRQKEHTPVLCNAPILRTTMNEGNPFIFSRNRLSGLAVVKRDNK